MAMNAVAITVQEVQTACVMTIQIVRDITRENKFVAPEFARVRANPVQILDLVAVTLEPVNLSRTYDSRHTTARLVMWRRSAL